MLEGPELPSRQRAGGRDPAELNAIDADSGEQSFDCDLATAHARDPDSLSEIERILESCCEQHYFLMLGRIGQLVVIILEDRAILADSLREKLVDQPGDRTVSGSEGCEILQTHRIRGPSSAGRRLHEEARAPFC